MTSNAIIAFSASAEPWIALVAGAALAAAAASAIRARRRPTTARPSLDARIAGRTEALVLAVVLAGAFASRIVGWDDALAPPFWFSQVSTLYVADMLDEGSWWTSWARLFGTTDVGWAHQSVVLLPLLAALQRGLGPGFGIPVVAGCCLGTLSVLLAWALGRRMRSQTFGLVLAALVAGSPLQLTWARLGAYYVAAVPQVLLGLLAGHVAGRRRSVVLAAVAGLVAWSSLYQYYAARVAIPLTALAIVAGTPPGTRLGRRALLLLVWCVALAGAGYVLAGPTATRTLWPSYGGYAGSKGEHGIVEFLSRNMPDFVAQARTVPERYFLRHRTAANPPAGYAAGMQYGGLSLVPTAVLGAAGALLALRHLRRDWLWLLVAAAGLALPIASFTTARRLLVLDLAWCAFSAHALIGLADTLGSGWSRRARAAALALAVGLVAAWGAAAVLALSETLPAAAGQPVPFGEAGFGDGTTCRRCLETARGWQRGIATGDFVVLFDNDRARENRTNPGGLVVYGRIAARAAGRPGSFVEGYALLANWNDEQPTPGVPFHDDAQSFAGDLGDRIERSGARRIVWHFERPTQWEHWLARRLAERGGKLETFPTVLSPTPGVRVTTPWERRAEALALMHDLEAGSSPAEDSPCVTITTQTTAQMDGPVLVLAAAPGSGRTSPPEWLATSWADVRLGARRFRYRTAIGAAVPRDLATGSLELYGEFGRRAAIALASGVQTITNDRPIGNPGFNCVVFADGHWWTVDPVRGRVDSTHPNAAAVPGGAWIGAAAGVDTLVLASGDQSLLVYEPRTGRVVRRFPARVSPSVRIGTAECSQIALGEAWIATVDLRLGTASFYGEDGRALGTKRIDPDRRRGEMLSAVAGAGQYLATGTTVGVVRTFRVAIDPACAATVAAGAP